MSHPIINGLATYGIIRTYLLGKPLVAFLLTIIFIVGPLWFIGGVAIVILLMFKYVFIVGAVVLAIFLLFQIATIQDVALRITLAIGYVLSVLFFTLIIISANRENNTYKLPVELKDVVTSYWTKNNVICAKTKDGESGIIRGTTVDTDFVVFSALCLR